MSTIYDFTIGGHVTSANPGSGITIGDTFSLVIHFPADAADQNSDPAFGLFRGLSGEYVFGSIQGHGTFGSLAASFPLSDGMSLSDEPGTLTGYPGHSFLVNIGDTSGLLIDNPNDPVSLFSTIAERYNAPLYLKEVDISDVNGLQGVIGIDNISLQTATSVPDSTSTGLLMVLALTILFVAQKRWRFKGKRCTKLTYA